MHNNALLNKNFDFSECFGTFLKNIKETRTHYIFSTDHLIWLCCFFDWNIGDGRMFKLPSGKRDYLLPDGEKHDYDW